MKKAAAMLAAVLLMGTTAMAEEAVRVDFDLTKMNQMMSFATLSNIIDTPQNYAGKTFRLRGFYQEFRFNDPNHVWQMLSEADRTACCYTDGEVLLPYCFDKSEEFEIPELEQLHEIVGTIEQVDRGDRMVWTLHVTSLTPMEGTLEDVRWP